MRLWRVILTLFCGWKIEVKVRWHFARFRSDLNTLQSIVCTFFLFNRSLKTMQTNSLSLLHIFMHRALKLISCIWVRSLLQFITSIEFYWKSWSMYLQELSKIRLFSLVSNLCRSVFNIVCLFMTSLFWLHWLGPFILRQIKHKIAMCRWF